MYLMFVNNFICRQFAILIIKYCWEISKYQNIEERVNKIVFKYIHIRHHNCIKDNTLHELSQ